MVCTLLPDEIVVEGGERGQGNQSSVGVCWVFVQRIVQQIQSHAQ